GGLIAAGVLFRFVLFGFLFGVVYFKIGLLIGGGARCYCGPPFVYRNAIVSVARLRESSHPERATCK
ncbi:hypothetical protein, partial [Mesorhizobium sp. M0088]|uniref:hypothetical protein n=1 Tax=Mesorhizobium sp. M0088 TaxID=2956873 RepID=UPI003338EF1C